MNKKIITLFVTSCFLVSLILAQGDRTLLPKILSPNATGIEKFGEVPVSLFAGIPDITIPLHTVTYGSISIPLNLRYHPGLVKPSIQPGWTGMGWDLDGIGRITRQVRYQIDEDNVDLSDPPNYLGTGGQYYDGMGAISGSTLANDYPSWATVENLNWDFERPTTFNPQPGTGYRRSPRTDVMADEFSFNFLGHSGKFYYNGSTKKWQVISEEAIKVVFDNDFIEGNELRSELAKHSGVNLSPEFPDQQYTGRMFKQFKLITPDGTQFVFGGNDAIEFSLSEYYAPIRNYTHFFSYIMTANSWMLKYIIDPNGNRIDFNYEHGNLIFNLPVHYGGGYSFTTNGSPISSPPIFPYTPFTSYVDVNRYREELEAPLYVSSISTPNEKISFSRSNPTCLRFSNDQVLNYYTTNTSDVRPLYGLLGSNLPANLSNTGPQQLDEITVIQKAFNSTLEKFSFSYSSNSLQRLTLNSIIRKDQADNTINQYSFSYNTSSSGLFQTDYTGNYGDHWGFYNATDIDGASPTQIFIRKEPDATTILSGLLNQITYPTGGHTEFTWEICDYGKVVSLDRQSLPFYTGIGGGIRIRKIQSYSASNNLATQKEYYYRTGYNSTVSDINYLPSSGILNCLPQYTGQVNYNGFACSYVYFNSFVQYSFNGQGTPVGYPEVVEVNKDGSYTKYYYTSYDSDLNNVSHFDQPPLNAIGWVPGVDPYVPGTSLELERGKLTGEFIYNSNDILSKKTLYAYRQDPGRFNFYMNWIENGGAYIYNDFSGNQYPPYISFGASCKKLQYSYYPVSKTTTSYDKNGGNPISTVSLYLRNGDNQVIRELNTNSKSNNVLTIYQYPKDFVPTSVVYSEMVNRNILSPIIKKLTTVDGETASVETTNFYSPSTGKYLPQSTSLQKGDSDPVPQRTFSMYDMYGNLIEQQKTNDIKESYQWGLSGQYPIVKITNAANNYSVTTIAEPPNTQSGSMDTYNPTRVITFTSQTTLDIATTDNPPASYGYQVHITIQGPRYYNVDLCSSYGEDCTLPRDIRIQNIPPGTYTISFDGIQGPYGNGITYQYFNSGTITKETYNGEFFYESFEENSTATSGNSHSGKNFYSANYTVNYVVPNSKSYIIQWWNFVNGKWKFNQQLYTGSTTLTGPVDDVRIFPKNASITTYTYAPVIGMTSETDTNGKTIYYEYDSLGRLKYLKDNEGNVIKSFDYQYQKLPSQ